MAVFGIRNSFFSTAFCLHHFYNNQINHTEHICNQWIKSPIDYVKCMLLKIEPPFFLCNCSTLLHIYNLVIKCGACVAWSIVNDDGNLLFTTPKQLIEIEFTSFYLHFISFIICGIECNFYWKNMFGKRAFTFV